MERSFARSVRYGFGRARWRGLWRVRIQEYLTAAIQNIQILMKHGTDPRIAVGVAKVDGEFNGKIRGLFKSFKKFLLDFFCLSKCRVEPNLVLKTSSLIKTKSIRATARQDLTPTSRRYY